MKHRGLDWDRRVNELIDRLPPRIRPFLRWLRKPSARWVRIPIGILLIFGSLLSILPVFGLWMLPLGLLLLAEDIAPLRRFVIRAIDWTSRRWARWRNWARPSSEKDEISRDETR
jgi:hypothetical protein